MDPLELIEGLSRNDAYPGRPERVELRTTHASLLFFAGERVYKVKKSVDLGFLDFSTPEKRRHFCEEEVRLNRPLAPWVYLGVVPIRRAPDGRLRVDGAGETVEWTVEMVRLPAERMLDELLARGEVDPRKMDEVCEHLIEFHRQAPTGPGVNEHGSPQAVSRVIEENLGSLWPLSAATAVTDGRAAPAWPTELLAYLAGETRSFLDANRALFLRRVEEGRIREGHGDLHAGNLCFAPEGLAIYDRIEFSTELRCVDVASDLAFLCMDLDRRGYPNLGNYLAHRYVERARDPEIRSLLGFYKTYRALVRAKVALLSARAAGTSAEARAAYRRDALQYLQLATSYSLGPVLVLLCGLPGTGKTWVGRALSRPLRAVLLRSDVRRKTLALLTSGGRTETGLDRGVHAPENRDRTYRSLAKHAVLLAEKGTSVIVDASFSKRAWRQAFVDASSRVGCPTYVVHVTAPREVVRERLERRVLDPGEASQATFEIYEAERRRFEPPDEVAPGHRFDFASPTAEPEALVSELLRRRIACERGTGAPANMDVSSVPVPKARLDPMQVASIEETRQRNMDPKIKVFLVDDQAMIRAAVKSFLGQRERFEVVGSSGDARKAVDEIQQARPDVVVLDITMPGLSGLDAIPLIRKALPKTKVVMLTHHEGETVVEQALRAGAEGYLSKDSDPAELALAIEAVHRGDPFVSPKVAAGLVTGFRSGRDGEVAPRSRLGVLTPREREVFQLLALGKSNKEVAVALEMSLGTAKKHRENLQRKLQCNSAAELARLAIREGLLQA